MKVQEVHSPPHLSISKAFQKAMKIQIIELEESPDDPQAQLLTCPACGRRWLEVHEDHEGDLADPDCPHLRFLMAPAHDALEFFNGYTYEELIEQVEPAARKLDPDLDGMSVAEFFQNRGCWDESFWENVEAAGFDAIFMLIDLGMACGPVSDVTFFGANLIRNS